MNSVQNLGIFLCSKLHYWKKKGQDEKLSAVFNLYLLLQKQKQVKYNSPPSMYSSYIKADIVQMLW